MKFEFDKNLYRLARAFDKRGATLYIVGGFVRDALLGRPAGDIDLCSRLKLNQVEECARECGFNYICLSSKMGVCKLTIKMKMAKCLVSSTPHLEKKNISVMEVILQLRLNLLTR